MKIIDTRTGREDRGVIVNLGWNFTIGEERVIVTLDTGFQVELYLRELDMIRPLVRGGKR